MIPGNERLIVITGMSNTGTTILTWLLQQHPEITLVTNGCEGWYGENDWLRYRDSLPIQRLLHQNPGRVLLKRPWIFDEGADWLKSELPQARFLYTVRPFEDVAASWSKPDSECGPVTRALPLDEKCALYCRCLERCQELEGVLPVLRVEHEELCRAPQEVLDRACAWLGLRSHAFDVSEVQAGDIKDKLWRCELRL